MIKIPIMVIIFFIPLIFMLGFLCGQLYESIKEIKKLSEDIREKSLKLFELYQEMSESEAKIEKLQKAL